MDTLNTDLELSVRPDKTTVRLPAHLQEHGIEGHFRVVPAFVPNLSWQIFGSLVAYLRVAERINVHRPRAHQRSGVAAQCTLDPLLEKSREHILGVRGKVLAVERGRALGRIPAFRNTCFSRPTFSCACPEPVLVNTFGFWYKMAPRKGIFRTDSRSSPSSAGNHPRPSTSFPLCTLAMGRLSHCQSGRPASRSPCWYACPQPYCTACLPAGTRLCVQGDQRQRCHRCRHARPRSEGSSAGGHVLMRILDLHVYVASCASECGTLRLMSS